MAVTETETALDVRPLSAVIGAEIRGVSLRDEVSDSTIAAIRAELLAHRVIFFPGQHLSPGQHVAFAKRFGEVTPAHPVLPGIEGHPEVFEIDYGAARRVAAAKEPKQGLDWHSDVTFVPRPPMGSILNATQIPASGGDTMWSNQVAAFASLSPAMQDFLRGLTALHDGRRAFGWALGKNGKGVEWDGKVYETLEPVAHPVVRVHPETGEESLFVNGGFTTRIVELSRAESDDLLAFLLAQATRPELTVRYHWSTGDLGFWDNRSTQHAVVGDYGTQDRVIQRVTIKGDEPRR